MTQEEFEASVIPTVSQAWPSFARRWNPFNQRVAFKLLSPFPIHSVLNGIEDHRYENPDARAPEFKAIAGRLWGKRRATGQSASSKDRDLRTIAHTWSQGKSDEDLRHLAFVAEQTYSVQLPQLWPFMRWCLEELPRCPLSRIVAWSAERGEWLDFAVGSDEWHELYIEYDLQEKRKMTEEFRDRASAPESQKAEAVVAVAPSGVVQEEKSIEYPEDSIPF